MRSAASTCRARLAVTIGAAALVFALVEGPEIGWDATSVVSALALSTIRSHAGRLSTCCDACLEKLRQSR